jgi:hypothetical protein
MGESAIVLIRPHVLKVRLSTAKTLEQQGYLTFHPLEALPPGFYAPSMGVTPAFVMGRIKKLERQPPSPSADKCLKTEHP